MLCIPDCVARRVWFAVPQATEWQRIGNQIDAAMIFARADFVKICTVLYPLILSTGELNSQL
jgi:hypothetical protein